MFHLNKFSLPFLQISVSACQYVLNQFFDFLREHELLVLAGYRKDRSDSECGVLKLDSSAAYIVTVRHVEARDMTTALFVCFNKQVSNVSDFSSLICAAQHARHVSVSFWLNSRVVAFFFLLLHIERDGGDFTRFCKMLSN